MLQRIVRGLATRPVAVSMPRYSLSSSTSLDAALQALGMTDAFNEARADFSRIAPQARLFVGAIEHAANLEVAEEGTVAAAATTVVIEATGAISYPHLAVFDANRPFLFFLRDDRTGAVLFAGRLLDASAAKG